MSTHGCAACGQEIAAWRRCPNSLCDRADRQWTVIFAFGVHRGPLRRAIVAYKYRAERWWGPVLARLVAGWLQAHQTWVEDFDLLVPSPCYLGPGARRDWDPVGEMTGEVGRLLAGRWEVAPGAVIKTAETPAMTGQAGARRAAQAQGPLRAALAVPDPARVASARILVVDDVVTDGVTLREVARVLRSAGAAEVAGLALARPALARPALAHPGLAQPGRLSRSGQ